MDLFFPQKVFAGDCFPAATAAYRTYLQTAWIIVFIWLFSVMIVINYCLLTLLYRRLKLV